MVEEPKEPTPGRGALYATDCSQCENKLTVKLPPTEPHKPAVWADCHQCQHTNWLEKATG